MRAIRRDAVAEHHFPLCVQDGQTVTGLDLLYFDLKENK